MSPWPFPGMHQPRTGATRSKPHSPQLRQRPTVFTVSSDKGVDLPRLTKIEAIPGSPCLNLLRHASDQMRRDTGSLTAWCGTSKESTPAWARWALYGPCPFPSNRRQSPACWAACFR